MKNLNLQQPSRDEVKDVLYRLIERLDEPDSEITEDVIKDVEQAIERLRSDEDQLDHPISKKLTQADLPERLTNPAYGREEIEKKRKALAANAPSIEEIWKITERLPSLTKLLLEGRQ